MHTYRQRVDPDTNELIWEVGFAGADPLDSRSFRSMAEYDNPSDAAAFVNYLNGGAATGIPVSGGEEAKRKRSQA
jgi:hypothetical protein